MSLYKDASLVMIPSAVKDGKLYSIRPTDGSGDFTFSRGSNLAATRVDVNGLIEKGRENLYLNSGDLSAATWGTFAGASTANASTAPDGSNNAIKFVPTPQSTFHYINANSSISVTNGGVVCFSIYLKRAGYDYILLNTSQGSSNGNAGPVIDLVNGVVANNYTYTYDVTIESAGNDWWRVSYYYTTNATTANIDFNVLPNTSISPYSGDGTSGVFMWGAQLEQGLVATDYIETGASTAQAGILEDLPRLDYSGGASCPALLLEPLRSNLLPYSEYISSSDYVLDFVTSLNNQTTSPEGVQNAALISGDGNPNDHALYDLQNLSVGTYTLSAFVKKNTQRYVFLSFNQLNVATYWSSSVFDLDTLEKADYSSGTYSNGTSRIEDYGNDWYRISLTASIPNATDIIPFIGLASSTSAPNASRGRYAFTTTDSFYLYGFQLEAGSYPTSYIPTYGSAVTRSQENCYKTGISDLIGQTQGTIFFDWIMNHESPNTSEDLYTLSLSDGSGNHMVGINNYNQTLAVFIKDTTTQFFDNSYTGGADGARIKLALGYANNDIALYINGTQIATDSSASIPALSEIRLNTFWTGNLPDNSSVNQLSLFKTRLTNAELAALTTI